MRFALGQELQPEFGDSWSPEPGIEEPSLADRMTRFEKAVIRDCLTRNEFRLKPTYEELGVSRKTLYDKIKKHGLTEQSLEEE